MIHVYTASHPSPHARAPETVSTYVTPTPANHDEVVRRVGGFTSERVVRVDHFKLDFPQVADGADGLDEVFARYTDCARCHLSCTRTRICYVKGYNFAAPVVAVGTGPGKRADTSGVCSVGAGGQLQDELFREAGIDPMNDLTWIDMVGCRPCDGRSRPDRPPSLVEKVACGERTQMLLQALRPRVVLCLGEPSTALFWDEPPKPNTWHTLRPRDYPDDWIVVGVLRHPAYLLRSVMTRYQEYFAAKLSLRRLKRRLPMLSKPSAWRFQPLYLSDVQPSVDGWKGG